MRALLLALSLTLAAPLAAIAEDVGGAHSLPCKLCLLRGDGYAG